MIYMVDHIFGNPSTEQAWHDWYSGYLKKLLSVPGIHSAQRFKAVDHRPSRYLAMYSIESPAVYDSAAYKGIGGGGSQSASFHKDYVLWTRNLFDGAARAPEILPGQRVLVIDNPQPDHPFPAGLQPQWLQSVGLHKTTPWRGIALLPPDMNTNAAIAKGGFVYEPFTPPLND